MLAKGEQPKITVCEAKLYKDCCRFLNGMLYGNFLLISTTDDWLSNRQLVLLKNTLLTLSLSREPRHECPNFPKGLKNMSSF
jgi:hypothetical protein